MYGTIQTPTFNVSPMHDNRTSSPAFGVSSAPATAAHTTSSHTQSSSIAFIHEPIESFQRSPPPPTAVPSSAPPPPPPSTPAPTQSHSTHHQPIAPATSSALSPSFSATASSSSLSSTIQSFHLQQTPRLTLDDATFDDGGDLFQQCMIPPYAPPVPALPYTQSHVPESMSLQLKMDNAYAQRPASLPFSPSSTALLGSGAVNSSTSMNTKDFNSSIMYHGNAPSEDGLRSPSSPPTHWREQEVKQTRRQSWQPSVHGASSSHAQTTPPLPVSVSHVAEAIAHGQNRDQEQKHEHYRPQSPPRQPQRQQQHRREEGAENQAVTLFMSMEVCCARVSDQVTSMWGYYPQEFAHRSLYDFVSPKDTDRLARLHRLLLDNITDLAEENDPDFCGPPPPTERTTADFFHSMDVAVLSQVASGSRTFSDSLHIKKRSGEEELYEMLVCLGGGIGADLRDTSSLDRLYLIAQFRKHNYEVGLRTVVLDTSSSTFGGKRTSSTSNSHGDSNKNNNSSSSGGGNNGDDRRSSEEHRRKLSTSPKLQSFRSNNGLARPSLTSSSSFRTAPGAASFSRSSVFDLRSRYGSSIPAHYARSSHLNTVTRIGSAKVNVAPMTCQRTGSTSPSSTSPPSSSSSSWQRRMDNVLPKANTGGLPNVSPAVAAAASSGGSGVMRGPAANLPPLSGARESNNPYSTLAYRFAPIAAAKTATGSPQGGPNVTHPTTQYFLQTSSSTLNAAASAAQYGTRRNNMLFGSNMADNDRASGKTDSNRKVEMSIRSLLC